MLLLVCGTPEHRASDIPLRGSPRLPGKSELEHAKTSIAIPDLIPRCGGSSPAAPTGQVRNVTYVSGRSQSLTHTESGRARNATKWVDLLVFTGGIGEHDAKVRTEICGGLAWIGVSLDEARNRSATPIKQQRRSCATSSATAPRCVHS